jgi:lipoyl(octanoyl) transferase
VIDLTLFENPIENIYIFKKWNWDYLEAEKFQLACVDFVYQNPQISILIICSHPHCFTLGRGLQKIKETASYNLVDFDQEIKLPFPLHAIKRGGGLTFHYPGQFVCYPIINLTVNKLAVYDLMLSIMEVVKNIIQIQFPIQGLEIKKDFLGLWFEGNLASAKVASIGLAANRYITYHGLALNFLNDESMFDALKSVHPCGLPGDIYKDLETLLSKKISLEDREIFCNKFIDSFIEYLKPNYLMIERQRSSAEIFNSTSEEVYLEI